MPTPRPVEQEVLSFEMAPDPDPAHAQWSSDIPDFDIVVSRNPSSKKIVGVQVVFHVAASQGILEQLKGSPLSRTVVMKKKANRFEFKVKVPLENIGFSEDGKDLRRVSDLTVLYSVWDGEGGENWWYEKASLETGNLDEGGKVLWLTGEAPRKFIPSHSR
jgi:hypothetical protein